MHSVFFVLGAVTKKKFDVTTPRLISRPTTTKRSTHIPRSNNENSGTTVGLLIYKAFQYHELIYVN